MIASAHGVEAVLGHASEAKACGAEGSIDSVRRAGEGAGPQRTAILAGEGVTKPARVPGQVSLMGEQVMGEPNGLSALQVGVAR